MTHESGTATPATLPLDTLSGREVWLSAYGIAFGSGTVYAFRDVTDQRELESLRSDTIATVSHELRTPIAAVYGAVKTLRGQSVDPATSERLLDLIDSESTRLAALVEEILLVSQIDAGRVMIAQTAIDANDVVRAATRTFDSAGVAVEVETGTPAAAGDPEKLRQVLANLLENALKDGGAPVTLRSYGGRSVVGLEVSDGGDGVPAHEQQHIFEKFHRLEPHLHAGIRGTGLGLYICRELVRRMHGRIGVDSREGHGATFWVEIPATTEGARR